MNTDIKSSKIRGAMVGLVCGDSLYSVDEKPNHNYRIWSNATSMSLCILQSLIERGFDATDQLSKYTMWCIADYMTPQLRFNVNVGNTTARALKRFMRRHEPFVGPVDDDCASNGSLTRLAPIPTFFHNDIGTTTICAGLSSLTTHGHEDCISACKFAAKLIWLSLNGFEKEMILHRDTHRAIYNSEILSGKILRIAFGSYKEKSIKELIGDKSAVNTLEVALWAFYHTNSFKDGAFKIIDMRLGPEETESIGAVYGQIAGAYYGIENIPQYWIDRIIKKDMINVMIDTLIQKNIPLNSF